jgi:pimeloyl-ACP methyl ester carboxylesterase
MESPEVTRYARSGDVHIAFRVTGSGPHEFVLVLDGNIPLDTMLEEPSLTRFLDALNAFGRVICLDRRGTGASDPVPVSHPLTLEDWARDIDAVLDELGVSRASLIGFAEGGFVQSFYAATRPERVAALVLVNATPGLTMEPFRNWGTAAVMLETLRGKVEDAWGDVGFGIPAFAPSAAGDERYRGWLQRSAQRALSPAMAAMVFDVLYDTDVRDVLPSIQASTLVIHRRDNTYVTPEHGRYLAEHIPNARYVEVDGRDHVPYIGDQTPILDAIEEFLTGAVADRHLMVDRVLTTVLFTDIVDSTARAHDLGDDRWRRLLEAHNTEAIEQIERFRGRWVKSTGDGILACFDGPARAVLCAQAIIARSRLLGIEVRAAVHTGEIELLGDDIAGLAVHVAARLLGFADAGHIVTSQTVRDLTSGSGLEFHPLGPKQAKGVTDALDVFEVRA